MNTEKIMEDIQSVQDNIREIKSTWGNTIMTLDNIKSGLKADVQKKTMESFQRGHDDGYEAGCATAFKPVSDAEYQRGLDDAMSAFKKLYSCGWEQEFKAMGFEFDEGDWGTSFEFIINHYTAAEIVEKVKAYKDKKIHVGDFVSHNNVTEIIVLVTYVGCNTFNGVAMTDVEDHCRKGESYTYCASEDWHKVNMQLVKGAES